MDTEINQELQERLRQGEKRIQQQSGVNARLYEQQRKRAAQLALVNAIGREATSILDLDQLLNRATKAIHESFGYHDVLIAFVDYEAGELIRMSRAGPYQERTPKGTRQKLDPEKGIINHVALTGRTCLANDVTREPRYEALFPETRAELCVPIKSRDKIVGILNVESDRLNAFDESDVIAMETLADQLAVAIENARLYQEVRATKNYLENLVASSVDAIATTDEHGVLTLWSPGAERIMGFKAEEMLGQPVWKYYVGGIKEAHKVMSILREQGELRNYETGFWHKEGYEVPVSLSASLLKDDQGNVIGTLGVAKDVTERKKAEQEVRWRAETLAALHETALDLVSQQALPELLQAIVVRAVDLLDAQGGSLYLYRPTTDDLEWVLEHNLEPDFTGVVLKRGEGLSGKVLETGRPMAVADYSHWEGRAAQYEEAPFTACVAVPIFWGDRPLGVLNVLDDAPRTFSPEDIALLERLTPLAAAALEQTRLLEEERTRRREAETLRQAVAAVAETLGLNETLDRILEHLTQVVPYDSATVMLVSNDVLRVMAARGFPDVERSMQVTIPVDDVLFQEMVSTRRPVVLTDAQKDERFTATGETSYVRGWIGAPLVVKGQVIGTLTVDSRQPGTYGLEEAEIVAAFANQAAIAIENARLYEETRHRTERLTVVNRIARAAGATLRLGELVDIVYQEVARVFQADAFFLALYDPEANELDYRLRVDEGIRELPERRPLQQGLTDLIVTEKKPILIRDFEKEKDHLPPVRMWGTMKAPPSWLGVPMLIGDRVVGVISVQAYRPNAYSEEDQLLLSTIADQVAMAVENARLYEETQRRLAREERLNELAHTLGGETELATLIPRFLPPVVALTGADAGAVAVLDPERQVITYPYNYNLPDNLAGVEVPAGSGLAGYTMQSRRTIVLDDYREHPAALQPWIEAGVRSILAVPLLAGDVVVGSMGLFTLREMRPFGPEAVVTAEAAGRLAAVAIQRAWLFQQEQRQREEAETLREAALALTTTLERNEVVERILGQLQQVVPYDAASVQLLKGDKLEIIGGRGFPNLPELLGLSFPLDGDNPNREVVRSRAPFILEDAPTVYEEFRREPHAQANIHSWLGVPMLVGERLVGMIALDKREVGFYTPEHARLARAFAAQAAIVIENARLFEEEQRRAAQLAVVNEVSRHATSTLKLEQMLRDVTYAIQIGFGYYNVSTFLVEGEYAVLKAIAGGFAKVVKDDYRQHLSQGIIGWAITYDQTVLANDVSQDPHFIPGFLKKADTRSELCVPIRVDGKAVGALDVQSTELNTFDQWDVRALETLADQMALALKNALAYGRLDEEKRRLELLYGVAAEVNRSLDLDEILARAIQRITTTLGGARGYVFLVEPGTDRLRLHAASGVEVSLSELNEALDVHVGQGLVGWVTAHCQPAVVDDVTQDERWLYVDELDRGIHSVMSVPLVRGEETLGAISVLHPTPGFFDEEQSRLLMAIAQQVAVAVANARLHETVREQAMLDSLTQVYNHSELIRRLREAVEEATRENQPLSFIMLDIDYFKEYNDRYGHVTGDLILTAIVQAIRANVKKNDVVGRWGGEEFGIVLPHTDAAQAQVVAERIRHTVATMPLSDDKDQEVPKPTVSQGIATYPTTAASAEELIDLADAALYRAKAKGKDQVHVA